MIPPRFMRQAKRFVRSHLGEAEDARTARLLALLLQEKRARLQQSRGIDPHHGTAERLNRKRFRRTKIAAYKYKITKRRGWRKPVDLDAMLYRYKGHRIADALRPERRTQWKPMLKRERDCSAAVVDISHFSFLDHPIETLRTIQQILEAEEQHLKVRVNFDFAFCVDIGPFLVMSELWPHLAPVFSGGRMMPPVQKVVHAVGLNRPLKMSFPGLRDLADVWAMPVQRRRPSGTSQSATRNLDPQSREEVTDRLCDQIDEWLDFSGSECQLNENGRLHFGNLVGEVLDNAERHASYADKDGAWSVAAFMAKREDGERDSYRCYMSFLSVGDTFSESLEATAAPDVRSQVNQVVAKLQRSAGARQSRETLLTLAAIQDGVTRDPLAFAEGRGGTGLLDIADFVSFLGQTLTGRDSAQMTILSGRSCITLKSPYMVGTTRGEATGRNLWFNEANSSDQPPNPEHVSDLPIFFPGTVISVAFTLDPDLFKGALHGDHRADRPDEG